jgi:hypothetical protein
MDECPPQKKGEWYAIKQYLCLPIILLEETKMAELAPRPSAGREEMMLGGKSMPAVTLFYRILYSIQSSSHPTSLHLHPGSTILSCNQCPVVQALSRIITMPCLCH